MKTLEVNRDELSTTRVIETSAELSQGEVLARIDHFSLTSNNVTYAVIGHMLGYWDFFPPANPGWGRVPAFGYAEIEESRCDGIAVGTRIYGYFPMATHVVLEPGRITDQGLHDMASHRQPMSSFYNRYSFADGDILHDPARESQRMLLYPLFATAFVIDDFFARNDYFGANVSIVSSASSKTAIGCAHNMGKRSGLDVVGLTSDRNLAFVESLGCYDQVLTYDNLDDLARSDESSRYVYTDMSGSGSLRQAVHSSLGDSLAFSSAVGITDWDDMGAAAGEPPSGPTPEMFFAPTQISGTDSEGREELERRLVGAWGDYSAWTDSWLRIADHQGTDALDDLWRGTLAGDVDPTIGNIVSLS